MIAPSRSAPAGLLPALLVLLSGIVAALHIAKVAPALPVLTEELGITLVQAGFLISLIHIAGMTIGLVLGLAMGGWGLKRSLVVGLLLCSVSSLAGGSAESINLLFLMRAVEGVGFLMIALAGPGLIRILVPPLRMPFMLGLWSTYMPLGSALAILSGPWIIGVAGWQPWWWLLAILSLAMAAWAALAVPDDHAPLLQAGTVTPRADRLGWRQRLSATLRAPGPWLIGFTFAVYAGQWLAIVGFLPSVYAAAGISGGAAGGLTALMAAVNIAGNVSSGRLLQRGVTPRRVLTYGFLGMTLSPMLAFVEVGGFSAPPALQYLGVLAFSAIGGVIPGTLFNLAVRFSPSADTVPTTVGWMQQWSAVGQLAIPPAVGWLAAMAGGWQLTWVATGLCSVAGLIFAYIIGGLLARPARG
ncbi:MAG: CynX/NimT family MFS transporter [Pigmentiphaga sp.]